MNHVSAAILLVLSAFQSTQPDAAPRPEIARRVRQRVMR
jgi:hypothetical protein